MISLIFFFPVIGVTWGFFPLPGTSDPHRTLPIVGYNVGAVLCSALPGAPGTAVSGSLGRGWPRPPRSRRSSASRRPGPRPPAERDCALLPPQPVGPPRPAPVSPSSRFILTFYFVETQRNCIASIPSFYHRHAVPWTCSNCTHIPLSCDPRCCTKDPIASADRVLLLIAFIALLWLSWPGILSSPGSQPHPGCLIISYLQCTNY